MIVDNSIYEALKKAGANRVRNLTIPFLTLVWILDGEKRLAFPV